MDTTAIPNVPNHKHLGLYLSGDGLWHTHIKEVCTKAWQRINLLRRLKYSIDRKSLEKMFITFIRPLLEYGDIVWDNCTAQQKKTIESIQTEAARICTGATKLCSLDKLYKEIRWESLAERRKKHKLIAMYKIINDISPEYLKSLLPDQTLNQSNYNLRTRENFITVPAKTQLYYNSFFPVTIREWNNLPSALRNAPTVGQFKSKLNNSVGKPPPYYYLGERKSQIQHTRLRLGCSSLKLDLHRKNIVDCPNCICGEIESTRHYLLECINYARERNTYLTNIPCELTTKNLLFGLENDTEHLNDEIFTKVQQFITATKRFV